MTERIELLTAKFLADELASAEAAELDALTAADSAACGRFVAELRLESALRGLGPIPDVASTTVDQVRREAEADLERAVMQTIGAMPPPNWSASSTASAARGTSWVVRLTIAAALALITTFGLRRLGERADDEALFPIVAATTESAELRHADRTIAATPGVRLRRDDAVITHDEDQVRLEYADGTQVDLFGPSELIVSLGPTGGKRLQLLHGGMELDVQPQPDGRPLVVVTPEGETQVLGTKFRLATGGDRTRIEMEEGKVAFVHRSDGRTTEVSEGAYILAEPQADAVTVHPLPPTLSAPLWLRKKTGAALALSGDGARLAVAGRHGGVLLLDPRSGETLADLSTEKETSDPTRRAADLAFTPDGRKLWAVDQPGELTLWNLDDRAQSTVPLAVDVGVVRTFDAAGRLFGHSLGKGHQRPFQVWDLSDAAKPRPLHVWHSREDLWGATISHGGKTAAMGSRTGRLHWFDVETGAELKQVQAGVGAVMRSVISHDERHLAYYSAQEGIRVFSLPDLELTATWIPEGPGVTSLAFAPDGRTLAAGLGDRTVRFWSLVERRPTLLINLPGDCARQLAFTPDGRLLATCGGDAAVWELP